MSLLKRASLPDQLYEELKRRIISLELPLGSRLNASELQKEFSVSSTPVREALNRLSQEGLIAYENNIGARVLDLTEKDINEITEVNFALQAGAMRLAMRKGNAIEIAGKIEAYIESCENVKDKGEITDYVIKIMYIFFDYVDNSRLNVTTGGLASQQKILISLCQKALERHHADFMTGLRDHHQMIRALRENDLNRAIDILEKISYTGRDFSIQGLAILKEDHSIA